MRTFSMKEQKMSTQWHQEYIQLAFRIEKIFKKQVELLRDYNIPLGKEMDY